METRFLGHAVKIKEWDKKLAKNMIVICNNFESMVLASKTY